MPQVPYTPYPTEKPDLRGTPSLRPEAPPDAFGVGVGQALEGRSAIGEAMARAGSTVGRAIEGLGKQIDASGDELFRRAIALQEVQNRAAAVKADADYQIAAGQLHVDFASLEGNNAVAAYPQYQQDLKSARERIRATLPNDATRRDYDSASLHTLGSSIFNGARHAASQTKAAANAASDAALSAGLNTITQNPTDEEGFQYQVDQLRGLAREKAAVRGFDKTVSDNMADDVTSKAWAHRLIGMSHTEPFEAIKLFEANRDKIRDPEMERLENTLYGKGINTEGRNIADRTMSTPDLSLAEYQKKAREEAENSPLTDESRRNQLADEVEKRVSAKWYQQKHSQVEAERDNWNTVIGGLIGKATGEIPQTMDELLMDTKVSAAYDALSNPKQRQVQGALITIARRGERVAPMISYQNYDKMRGMAIEKPDDFMNVNPWDPKLQMNFEDRKRIAELQFKKGMDPAGTASVNRALGWMQKDSALGAAMSELGIYKYSEKNKDDYFGFIGGLQAELENFQQQHGRVATQKDIKDTIGPNLLNQTNKPFIDWKTGDINFSNEDPYWRTKPPQDFIEEQKARAQVEGRTAPTDIQILRDWATTRLIQMKNAKESK